MIYKKILLVGLLGILLVIVSFFVNSPVKQANLVMNETTINLKINEILPIYQLYGADSWYIYEFSDETWKEIEISGCMSFGCRYTGCVNREPLILCSDPGPAICKKLDNDVMLNWDLTKCVTSEEYCGIKEYVTGSMDKVTLGKYKAKFCYYFDNKCSEQQKCIEKEFMIN